MLEERARATTPTPGRDWTRRRREIAASLDELREVARGIHPAVLTGHGLAVALEQLRPSRRSPSAEGRDRRALPEQVEVAAYYVVRESLANVAKHAQASTATCRGRAGTRRALLVEIVDDGIGGADSERGRVCAASRIASRPSAAGSASGARRRRHARRGGDSVRVAIAEDSVLLREGLARLLGEAGFEVVGQCENADDLCSRYAATRPRSRSSTSGCRRRTPTRGCGRRSRSARGTRRSACSCSRSTSSSGWR